MYVSTHVRMYTCVYMHVCVYLNIILSYSLHYSTLCTYKAVRATPIANGKPLVDRSLGNAIQFYRFVCQEKQKMIRITVKATKTQNLDNFSTSDCLDVYVTNAHNGLVAVGKDNYVWKCIGSENCNIDIHPTDQQVGKINFVSFTSFIYSMYSFIHF